MPLNDRDYMKPSSGRAGSSRSAADWITRNPVLVLIIINLVFFLATSIRPRLVDTLGLSPITVASRPWTVLSAMFVHIDVWHILGNMLTLFFFGTTLSQVIGQNKFLIVYFVGGIVGNLLFILLNLSAPVAVIGASGAVFAVGAALAVMMPKLQVRVYFVIPMPLWLVIVIFFGLWSIPDFIPGVAWQAHVGGLVTGLVSGFIFRKSGKFYYYYR
jgi:uncharacterized protein